MLIRKFLLKAFIISLPFYEISLFIPQLRLPTFIFFLYLFMSLPFRGKPLIFRYTTKPVLLLVTLYLLILTVSYSNYLPRYPATLSFFRQFPVYVICFHFISKELINRGITFQQFMQWFIMGVALFSVLFMLNINVTYGDDGRLRILGTNPNMIAIFCGQAFLMIINLLQKFNLKKIQRLFYFILLAVFIYITVLTGSRGGFISLVLAIFIYYVFSHRNILKKMKYTVKGLVIVSVITIIFLSNDILYSRLLQKDINAPIESQIEALGENRLPIWKAAYRITKDNLLFGVGLFRYEYNITRIMGEYYAVHNEYLAVFIFSGLAGLSIFLYFLSLIFKRSYSVYKIYENPIFFSLLIHLLFNLFKGGGLLLALNTWVLLSFIFSSEFYNPNNAFIKPQRTQRNIFGHKYL